MWSRHGIGIYIYFASCLKEFNHISRKDCKHRYAHEKQSVSFYQSLYMLGVFIVFGNKVGLWVNRTQGVTQDSMLRGRSIKRSNLNVQYGVQGYLNKNISNYQKK